MLSVLLVVLWRTVTSLSSVSLIWVPVSQAVECLLVECLLVVIRVAVSPAVVSREAVSREVQE
jgi:hypothetical protein